MYTTEQILDMLRAKKPQLQSKYPISELGIFGSYARGDYHEKSDIDILVDFNASLSVIFLCYWEIGVKKRNWSNCNSATLGSTIT
jgi:predicted nucleotidyltransferase